VVDQNCKFLNLHLKMGGGQKISFVCTHLVGGWGGSKNVHVQQARGCIQINTHMKFFAYIIYGWPFSGCPGGRLEFLILLVKDC